MTAQADNFAPALALKLITKYGVPAVLVLNSTAVYNPLTGLNSEGLVEALNIVATPPLDYVTEMAPVDVRLLDASYTFVAGNILKVPAIGMQLQVADRTWRIEKVETLRSGLQVAAYKLWIKA